MFFIADYILNITAGFEAVDEREEKLKYFYLFPIACVLILK